ncbi:MAG: endonuclease/exonuclease/phosphatase family protein [Bacteroidota bacterium]
MFFLKSFKGLLAIVSLLTGASLLIALASVYLDPAKLVIPALFGLAFPVIFLVNLILFGISLMRSRKWGIFHGILLLLGLVQMGNFCNLFPSSSPETEHKLRLMTFNVRNFNRYNWIEDSTIQAKIERLIAYEEADVVCFQEFHLRGRDDLRSIREFARRIGLKYYVYNDQKDIRDISGLVTFSRYPLHTVYRENFRDEIYGGNGLLIADFSAGSRKIRVINMHLESIRFERPDYDYAQDPTNENSQFKTGGIRILQRFVHAYRLRGKQARLVSKYVEESEYPVLVAGDANDTPISYSYHTMSSHLRDSFDKSGVGTGSTYAGSLPSFRIDYVFHSEQFCTVSHKVLKEEKLSDHYPILAEIGW